MALVRRIAEATKDRQNVHDEVECVASAFSENGHRYLQLDTFGSKERKLSGKVSQAMQFDRDGAIRLKELIEKTFPDI